MHSFSDPKLSLSRILLQSFRGTLVRWKGFCVLFSYSSLPSSLVPGLKCTSGSAHIPSSESLGITGHRMTSCDPSSLIPWAFLFKAGSPLLSPFYKPEALIHTVMLQHYWILATTLWEKYYHHQLYRWRYWDLEVDLPRVQVFSRYFSKATCQWGHVCTHKGHSQMDKTFDFRLSYSSTHLYLNHHLLSSLSYHLPKGSFEHCRVLVRIHTWRCSMGSCTNFWFD